MQNPFRYFQRLAPLQKMGIVLPTRARSIILSVFPAFVFALIWELIYTRRRR